MNGLYFIAGVGLGYFLKDIINIIVSKPRKRFVKLQPVNKKHMNNFRKTLLKMPKNPKGLVNKKDLLYALMEDTGLSRAQVYRIYNESKDSIKEIRINRRVYLKEMKE